jgi:hypothetical protein
MPDCLCRSTVSTQSILKSMSMSQERTEYVTQTKLNKDYTKRKITTRFCVIPVKHRTCLCLHNDKEEKTRL